MEVSMLKIVRIYNKNRRIIWTWIIIAIFVIIMVNALNQMYLNNSKKLMEESAEQQVELNETENPSEVVDYEEAAQSLTVGGAVNKEERNEIQGTLEKFIQHVTSGQIEQAYELLTEKCKKIEYPSIESFEKNYCHDLEQKTYDFQSWSSTRDLYIYQVRYYNDMLSSGIDTTKRYLQDYITVQKIGEQYKLNINSFINSETIMKEYEKNQIKFKIHSVETYLDYEIYEIEVTNNRLKQIILDTREKDNSVYVKNNDGLNIDALLYENREDEFQVQPGETKKIRIKFNNTYNGNKKIVAIGFSDIVIDKDLYANNSEQGKMEIEIKV